jgi:hypothetical protein
MFDYPDTKFNRVMDAISGAFLAVTMLAAICVATLI